MQGSRVLLVFVLVLLGAYGAPIGAFLILSTLATEANAQGLVIALLVIQFVELAFVAYFGTRGRTSDPRLLSYVGTFLLTLIPLAFIFPIYWVARYLALGGPHAASRASGNVEINARLASQHPNQPVGTRKCPYCAETIKAEAIVCRYCGRDIDPIPASALIAQVDDVNKILGKQGPAHDARKVPSKDPRYVFCSSCKFEQWSGYSECQKCGATFLD